MSCCTTIPAYITAVFFLCELDEWFCFRPKHVVDYFDNIELYLTEEFSSFIVTIYTKIEPP